jgi:hypothetical protein
MIKSKKSASDNQPRNGKPIARIVHHDAPYCLSSFSLSISSLDSQKAVELGTPLLAVFVVALSLLLLVKV